MFAPVNFLVATNVPKEVPSFVLLMAGGEGALLMGARKGQEIKNTALLMVVGSVAHLRIALKLQLVVRSCAQDTVVAEDV